ncbi:hypothetical protein [Novosphingobium malaysiense]|uniref:Uncharacterized protein n=1 Tax=Novosphingobium malaysiense TaxID=1348853 RepID=A0A0B1ZFK3_9SPHN|nr:hypothetical protein [Novosphingobium malaysiense]KHK89866.1 hypothetical protein LK12_18335 [Novosphingobium malaysiense]
MKLTTPTLLEGVADALRDQIAPQVNDDFAGQAVRMAQSLLRIVARSADDAAHVRITENAAIRVLLGEGAELVQDPAFARRLVEAAESSETGYRISELDAESGRLRTLMIELHAWLEEQQDEACRALDRTIWDAMAEVEQVRIPLA